MIKKLIKLAILILCIFLSGSICYAGNADSYKITILRIEMKKSDGSWVTIASPNQELDIASVSAGATAGSLVGAIPVGTYVNFKIVNSEIVKFNGSAGVNYTNAGGTVTIVGSDTNAASTATWGGAIPNATFTPTNTHTITLADKGEVTATLDLDAGDSDNYMEIYRSSDLTTPITVNADSVVSMFFDFDTQGTVNYINDGTNDVMYFTPPQTGTQFQLTVDGVATTITAADMQVDF